MALVRNHSSSSAPLDEKIKVQIIRMSKSNDQDEPSDSTDMVLLDSSGPRINTTIGESFSKWIRDIANEKTNEEVGIDILEDLLIANCRDPIETMVNNVFGGSFPQSYDHHEKAILCHVNYHVDQINDYMISKLSGEEKVCLSADSIAPSHANPNDYMLYPLKFLNSINVPGLPKHCLKLKVGASVMLLKDILDVLKGTILQITRMGGFVLEARVITGNNDGEIVLIPRMPMYLEVADCPKMRRTQFPLKLAFAMTIKESRGHTFSKVGLYLPRPPSFNEQIIVAISKVKTKAGLKVLVADKDQKPQDENVDAVVFKEVFQNI